MKSLGVALSKLIGSSLPRIDYRDEFTITIPKDSSLNLDQWFIEIFSQTPAWLDKLKRFRNLIFFLVKPFHAKIVPILLKIAASRIAPSQYSQ